MSSPQKTVAYLLTLATALARVEVTGAGRIPLTFSLIVSYGQFGFNSSSNIPAIDLALEHINTTGILGEYELQYYRAKDSKVIV